VLPTIQKNTIEFARLSRFYAARCAAIPALAGYPTLEAVLDALRGPPRRRADPGTRRRILCAVIAEHQAAPAPVWAAILLRAFGGMLVVFSNSLLGVDDPDEADALVAAGLLEGLKRVRPGRDPDRIAMYVRQETRRAVFAALDREKLARQYWSEDDEEEPSHAEDLRPDGEEPAEQVTPDDGGFDDVAFDDDSTADMTPRDPLEREAARRRIEPDMLFDPQSAVPIEDRMTVEPPAADNIHDDQLLRAHAIRGGLRRMTNHLFADASAGERENVYRLLLRRARRLLPDGRGGPKKKIDI
jgi:hypothetical protein